MNIKRFLRRLLFVVLFCAIGVLLHYNARLTPRISPHAHMSVPDSASNDGIITRDILAQLSHIKDPEIDINIVDLGLIHQVDIKDHAVAITLVATSPFCPFLEAIDRKIKEVLKPFYSADGVTVIVDDSIMWNYDMMTDEGKEKLKALYDGF